MSQSTPDKDYLSFYNEHFIPNRFKYEPLPDKDEHCGLFRVIESEWSKKQIKLLRVHYTSLNKTVTSTELGELSGFGPYQTVNKAYGSMANRFLELMGQKDRYSYHIRIFALLWEFRGLCANEKVVWTMHPQVAEALEELGWV